MESRSDRAGDGYDVVVIGSGFGGSVAALRLTEKGYRVAVLEAGARYEDDELPETSWDLRRFLWAPAFGLTGIQRIHTLRNVMILAGAGVGGGSLNYANTLYEPKTDAFYNDPQWADITDWRAELAPYYDQAKRMLGVVTNPTVTPADEVMRAVADEMDAGDTFHMADVGVFFGRDGAKEPGREVDDPFFGGAGPRRRGCLECGECMTGCRHNAKNTLLKNYLHLAESAGAEVHPLTTVTAVRDDGDGYLVETRETGPVWRRRRRRTFHAEQVVVAAGTWGTQHLLHQLKADGQLPRISDRLGELTRTNSESLSVASARWRNRGHVDFSRGVAITSSFHPNEHTHVEPVRYGTGSNSMALLAAPLLDGDSRWPRWLLMLLAVFVRPIAFVAHYLGLRDWSNRSIIALVMQTHDNSLTVRPRERRRPGGRVRLTSRQGRGEPNPTWIPEAAEAVTRVADHIDGRPYGSIGETFDIAGTAHFLGGCPIGASADQGVIDGYHRLFGHPGVHVVDGSAVSANLGVNPSLTITAQAERAMAMWPNRGDQDPRPEVGEPYRPVDAVAPVRPVVPATAPGALRLPIVAIGDGTGRSQTVGSAGSATGS